MRRFTFAAWTGALLVAALSGCADNAMVVKGQVDTYKQQQLALTRQNQQRQARATSLDRDNQEMGAMLAQVRQQSQVVEAQLAAVRDQLRGVTAQLTQAREEKKSADHKVQALTASVQRRGGASITPNNSFLKTLPAINLPGVNVRRDGDVIRIALPGNQLFESGSARLLPGATGVIASSTAELQATYPYQIIGIEGHTDSDPINGRGWHSNHQLSVARAMAVYDLLRTRSRYQPSQMFIVGHGPNHPIASNAAPEGKQRNRRVELVVYPEKIR